MYAEVSGRQTQEGGVVCPYRSLHNDKVAKQKVIDFVTSSSSWRPWSWLSLRTSSGTPGTQKKAVVEAVRTAPAEEDSAPAEEKALERAVAVLTILSKKKWQSGHNRCGG